MANKHTVGIDSGTTFSVVAYINEHGNVEIIPNSEGSRTTPSVFAIAEDGSYITGKSAIDQELLNPVNTIRSIKRKMGTSDRLNIANKIMSPEEISAEILKKLKKDTESFLGETITDAVITVPAYFNNDQRQSTKIAGELAGFNVLRIINEPTAAALAYGLDEKKNETVLVFDLGGGTFDVTILKITDDGIFDVQSTSGDTHLGGDDFDDAIIDIILDNIKENYILLNENNELIFKDQENLNKPIVTISKEIYTRLRDAAENCKIQLSSMSTSTILLPYLFYVKEPITIKFPITKELFENHPKIINLIERIQICVTNAMKDAHVTAEDIDEIVFVGGSTRVPFISNFIEKQFNKKPNKSINPDEAVAIGACIQAGILTGQRKRDILLLDVTPLSLGIETLGGVMTVMIDRNTTIPTEHKDIFSTAENNQNEVTIRIYQGERPQAANNKFLEELKLTEIPEAPRGVPQIEVGFEIDANGILSVKAIDVTTGKEQKVIITGSSSLNSEDINRIIEDATKNAEEDRLFAELTKIKTILQNQLLQIESILREVDADLNDSSKNELYSTKNKIEIIIKSDDKESMIELSNITEEIIKTVSEQIYAVADQYIEGV